MLDLLGRVVLLTVGQMELEIKIGSECCKNNKLCYYTHIQASFPVPVFYYKVELELHFVLIIVLALVLRCLGKK